MRRAAEACSSPRFDRRVRARAGERWQRAECTRRHPSPTRHTLRRRVARASCRRRRSAIRRRRARCRDFLDGLRRIDVRPRFARPVIRPSAHVRVVALVTSAAPSRRASSPRTSPIDLRRSPGPRAFRRGEGPCPRRAPEVDRGRRPRSGEDSAPLPLPI